MKIEFAAGCIAIGAVLAPIVTHAANLDPGRKPALTAAQDAELTARIKARLAEEKFSSLPNITIDSDAKGAVYLRGKVKTEQEADRMISTVHWVKGVTAVKSLFSITDDK